MVVITGDSGFAVIGIIILVIGVLMLVSRLNGSIISYGFTQPVSIDPDAASDAEVLDALAAGQKINAIKRYRGLTGVGLKEAKDAIEYLQMHPEAARKKKSSSGAAPVDAGIREMLRRGQKLEAIRAYQEFTGVSLSDARDEVERIAWEEQEADQRNNSGTQSQNQTSNR
jgi:ribosomal protein L7/L12